MDFLATKNQTRIAMMIIKSKPPTAAPMMIGIMLSSPLPPLPSFCPAFGSAISISVVSIIIWVFVCVGIVIGIFSPPVP